MPALSFVATANALLYEGAKAIMLDIGRTRDELTAAIYETLRANDMADGVRTLSVGKHNWAVLQYGLAGIIEVTEENIAEAVRILSQMANLKAEPTGALPIAARNAGLARMLGYIFNGNERAPANHVSGPGGDSVCPVHVRARRFLSEKRR